MAAQDENLNIKLRIDAAESATTVKELKLALKGLKDEAAGVEENSAAFNQLADAAGKAKKKIDDINIAIKSQTGDPIEKVTGSLGLMGSKLKELDFGAATNALKLFGSNLKAMPWKEITAGAQEFGVAMLELGAELLLNPIFLIVAALAAVGAALYLVAKQTSESVNKQIEKYDELEAKINHRYDLEMKLAKAAKKDTFDLEDKKLKVSQEVNRRQIKLLEALQATWIGLDSDQKKKLDELKTKSIDIYTDIAANQIEKYTKASEESKKKTEESLKNIEESNKKIQKIKDEEEADDKKRNDAWKKRHEERKKLEEELAKKALEEQKKLDAEELKNTEALVAKTRKLKEDEEMRLAGSDQAKLDIQKQRDIDAINAEYAKSNLGIEAQQAQKDALLLIDSKYMDDSNQLVLDAEAKKIESDKRATEAVKKNAEEETKKKKEEIDKQFNTANALSTSLMGLSDLVFSIKNANEVKGSKAALDSAKKQFKINKALQITGAIISTAKAAITSLAQSPLAIGPAPSPLGIASLAATIITGAASVAKIAATQFTGGEAGGSGAVATPTISGSGGSTGGPSTAPPPPPNFVAPQFFGLGQGGGGGQGGANRVVVVETDITRLQRNVNKIETRATQHL